MMGDWLDSKNISFEFMDKVTPNGIEKFLDTMEDGTYATIFTEEPDLSWDEWYDEYSHKKLYAENEEDENLGKGIVVIDAQKGNDAEIERRYF